MQDDLNARARHLLRVLIGHYIEGGEPVGSKTLARHSGLKLSPATIRNVMSELEAEGYIQSPHTSAGRIPTALGYRFFVDRLVTIEPLESQTSDRIEEKLAEPRPVSSVIDDASETLSALTNFVGVVMVPKREVFGFKHIDFVPVDSEQLLAVIVFQDGEVQNRILRMDRSYDPRELETAANYLNQGYTGLSLGEIRQALINELVSSQQEIDRHLQSAIDLARTVFGPSGGPDVVLRGETKLMGYDELSDVDKLKSLFNAFQEKRDILNLLDRTASAEGVQVFIGEETDNKALQPVSLVSAPYRVDGRVVGVLGVIGPTRMAYQRVISVVDTTAKILSSVLNQSS